MWKKGLEIESIQLLCMLKEIGYGSAAINLTESIQPFTKVIFLPTKKKGKTLQGKMCAAPIHFLTPDLTHPVLYNFAAFVLANGFIFI